MKNLHFPLVVFITLFFIAGCTIKSKDQETIEPTLEPTQEVIITQEPTPTIPSYDVSLTILDEFNVPIPGARVTSGNQIDNIDDTGIWKATTQNSDYAVTVWAQGFLPQVLRTNLLPGNNNLNIILKADPFGLKPSEMVLKGYKLVFVEDFQDNVVDCIKDGNGNIIDDETNPGNKVLLVDLRNVDTVFTCSFGPVGIQDAIIEYDFRYPEIRYDDFVVNESYNWQGFGLTFRDKFSVEGYPLHVPWGSQIQIRDFSTDDWSFPIAVNRNILENQWYKITTIYNKNSVEVKIDNKSLFDYLNPPTMINSAPANFGAYGKALIQFDNVKMWVPSE